MEAQVKHAESYLRTWTKDALLKRVMYLEDRKSAEPKIGQWEWVPTFPGRVRCPICCRCVIHNSWVKDGKYKFCPECGSKMEGIR